MNDTTPLPTTPIEPTDATSRAAEPTRQRFSARPILIGAGSALAVLALGIGGFAIADNFDDDRIVITSGATPFPEPTTATTTSPSQITTDDDQIDPADLKAVSGAALQAVGGGTVIEVDRGDSPGDAAWKVEIRLANGDEAEVRLDANLNVIRVDLDNDDDSGSDDDNDGDDNSGSNDD